MATWYGLEDPGIESQPVLVTARSKGVGLWPRLLEFQFRISPGAWIFVFCVVSKDKRQESRKRKNRGGDDIVSTRPGRPWGTPSLLHEGNSVAFPGVKLQARGFNHPPPYSAEVKERVELYLYSSGPSWSLLGRSLPFLYFCAVEIWIVLHGGSNMTGTICV